MTQQEDSAAKDYPLGRGYGHDYMRGGEVLGGYGYSQREEYERPRGELNPGDQSQPEPGADLEDESDGGSAEG